MFLCQQFPVFCPNAQSQLWPLSGEMYMRNVQEKCCLCLISLIPWSTCCSPFIAYFSVGINKGMLFYFSCVVFSMLCLIVYGNNLRSRVTFPLQRVKMVFAILTLFIKSDFDFRFLVFRFLWWLKERIFWNGPTSLLFFILFFYSTAKQMAWIL